MLMKKIFTLIAVAAMALSANAQTIKWTEVIEAGKVAAETYGSNGFVLTATDTNDKMSVDKNTAYFGDTDAQKSFDYRLKVGGKSTSQNSLSLTIPEAGTLKVYVRTAKSSETDRNVVLKQNDAELINKVIKEDEASDYVTVQIEGVDKKVFPVVSAAVVAGTVAITYPVGALNFYAFELVTATGIQTVKATVLNDAQFNLAGQRVAADSKGLVVKNGKKVVKK